MSTAVHHRPSRALELERLVAEACAPDKAPSIHLAAWLHEVESERLYEECGFSSMKGWLKSERVPRAYSTAAGIARVYRELVVARDVPLNELEGVDIRRLQMTLAAIREGEVPWQEAVEDCRSLTRPQVEAKYQPQAGSLEQRARRVEVALRRAAEAADGEKVLTAPQAIALADDIGLSGR